MIHATVMDQPGQPIGQTDAATNGEERLAATAHKGINAAADAVHPVIDRLASSAHRAVDSADHAGSKAGATGEQYYAAGVGYLRDHPVLTIGVAVAAGYLLSRLLATH
ncbi:MAG: hypothetical protein ACNA8J_07200 [Gammaproteobacteria bacterium]